MVSWKRNYRQKNKAEINKYLKQWRKNNPDKVKKHAEKNRTRYSNEKLCEYSKNWRSKNKEKHKFACSRRRYSFGKSRTDYNIEQWLECKKYFNNCCAYCGKEKELTRDHFVAFTRGGGYGKENIVPSCRSCNSSKYNKVFSEWYSDFKYYSVEREQKIVEYIKLSQIAVQV